MLRFKSISIKITALALIGALTGCGGSGGGNTDARSQSTQPGQFGETSGTRINLNSFSTSVKTDTQTLTKPEPDFWIKARDPNSNTMVFRYGIDREKYEGRTNHEINLTERNYRGVQGRTGQVSYIDPDSGPTTGATSRQLEAGVDARTMIVFDITNDVTTHGLIFTDDTGQRGSFHEAHAYAGGQGASNVPNAVTASYSGVFLGNIAEVGAAPNSTVIEMDANLSIDFGANTFSGTIGTNGSTDISLSGVRTTSTGTGTGGRQLDGTARIETNALGLAPGRNGPLDGRIFGDGATHAAGAISVEDGSGANRKVLIGSFGVSQ